MLQNPKILFRVFRYSDIVTYQLTEEKNPQMRLASPQHAVARHWLVV